MLSVKQRNKTTNPVPLEVVLVVEAAGGHLLAERDDVRGVFQVPVVVRPPLARDAHPGLHLVDYQRGTVLLQWIHAKLYWYWKFKILVITKHLVFTARTDYLNKIKF